MDDCIWNWSLDLEGGGTAGEKQETMGEESLEVASEAVLPDDIHEGFCVLM